MSSSSLQEIEARQIHFSAVKDKRLTSLHFAFVACNRNASRFREDSSFIYRCENPAAALEEAGHRTALLHLSSFPLLSRFDVVVFHRPRWSLRLLAILALLRRRGTVAIADFDDLVFDRNFAEASPGVVNALVSLKATSRNFQAAHRALSLFDRVTVSTEPLAAHVNACFPHALVKIVPNAVHLSWRRKTEEETPTRTGRIITYFPGTRSHDRDFAVVSDVLARFLERHEDVRLHVTGPLHFELPARPGQVIRREKVPYGEFHRYFKEGWVNIAPLETTPFNRCKSALKVLEAGYWNIPTVCTPIPDAERLEGAGALVAEGSEAWLARLESLLDGDYYDATTDGLRERVLKVAAAEDSAEGLIDFISQESKS
jgi:hypothetical protein